jgi:hypothetical protein
MVMQRRKENPDIGAENRVIKHFYISSPDKLQKQKEEIIKLCEVFNARAYIHLNCRSYKDVSFKMLEILAKNLQENNWKNNKNIWAKACGQKSSCKNKKWVVDIDSFDESLINGAMYVIDKIEPFNGGSKILAKIPTKNGVHLITSPFNKQKFSEHFPNTEVKTDNPTILFIP